MSEQGNLSDVISYWKEKSKESLDYAKDEIEAGRLSFAVIGFIIIRESIQVHVPTHWIHIILSKLTT